MIKKLWTVGDNFKYLAGVKLITPEFRILLSGKSRKGELKIANENGIKYHAYWDFKKNSVERYYSQSLDGVNHNFKKYHGLGGIIVDAIKAIHDTNISYGLLRVYSTLIKSKRLVLLKKKS